MPDPKVLTQNAWKNISLKFKVKEPDLQKALAEYDRLKDDEHDDLLACAAEIKKLALEFKKSKEAAANAALVKYLAEMVSAAEAEQREVGKDKAESAKDDANKKKAEDEAKKKEELEKKKSDAEDEDKDKDKDKDKDEEEDEEEEQDYKLKLTATLRKLKGVKDVSYQFIVCDAKPHCAVMVAKRISTKHRTELTKITGSKRFLHLGECRFEDGHYVFSMEKPVAGLARKLQEALKHHMGKRLPIKVGTEAAGADEEGGERDEDEGQAERGQGAADEGGGDEQEPSSNATDPERQGGNGAATPQEPLENMTRPFEISASVGRGGKNKPEDVTAVQVALNKKTKAGLKVDGKGGPKTIAAIEAFQRTLGMSRPDGRIDPGRGTARALASSGPAPTPPGPPQPIAPPKLPRPELGKAPNVWHSTRNIVDKNIKELKKAVRGHYAHEHPDLVAEIDKNIAKLDGIMNNIDHELANGLAKAHAAKDDAAREAQLKNCKNILAQHIKYVKSEPLIAHIDSNPFGVSTNLKQVLSEAFMHVAQSMATKKN
jgi:peptidoglycan hydrolase-like protein with peptidoglycan-binding domain